MADFRLGQRKNGLVLEPDPEDQGNDAPDNGNGEKTQNELPSQRQIG
jgi:hypothetical protein